MTRYSFFNARPIKTGFSPYPALRPVLAVSAGISLSQWTDPPVAILLSVSIITCSAAIPLFRNGRQHMVHLLVLVAIVSTSSANMQLEEPAPLVAVADRMSSRISAEVADWPIRGRFSNRIPVHSVVFRDDNGRKHFLRGLLVVTDAVVDSLYPGSVIGCTGQTDLPDIVRNPGGFNEVKYLNRYKAPFTFRCNSGTAVASGARYALTSRFTSLLRLKARASIHASIPDSTHWPLFEALILGDRSGLSDETKRHFQVTGLMHVLAVSGLHVMLVAMLAFVMLRQLLLRLGANWMLTEWTRFILSGMLLATYCLISGATPSIVRASVMAFIFMSSHVVGRLPSSINNLSLAGLVLLIFDPAQLFQAGFQLSFAAVLAIVTIVPQFGQVSGPMKVIAAPTFVTLAATLGTAPVLLKHFGSFSISGFLLNPLAIPLTALTLLTGILTVFNSSTVFGATFGASASLFTSLLTELTRWGHHHFRLEIFADYPADTTWLAILAIAIATARWDRISSRGKHLRIALVVTTLSMVCAIWNNRAQPSLDVIFLDIGQGDAALIRTPCGENYLVDTGPGSVDYSIGARTIYQTTRTFGIRSLDSIIISHPHSDHLGGLPELLEMIPVKNVVTNGQDYDSDLYTQSLTTIRDMSIDHQIPHSSAIRIKSKCTEIRLMRNQFAHDANDGSIIVRLDYGKTSFLFTGDVEEDTETSLVEQYSSLLSSNVIKVPHHGSGSSSSSRFVASTSAGRADGFAVISSGKNNRFGHPDSAVVNRWRLSGNKVLNTANHGAVWLRSNGSDVQEVRWK